MNPYSNLPALPTLLGVDMLNSTALQLKAGAPRRISYTPFGHALVEGIGFTGQLRETLTGKYLLGNGYRPFLPNLMRFATCDSISPFGAGGVNAYAYCQASPIQATDPSGHIPIPKFFKLMPKRKVWALKKVRGPLSEIPINHYEPRPPKIEYYAFYQKNKRAEKSVILLHQGKSIRDAKEAKDLARMAFSENERVLDKMTFAIGRDTIERHNVKLNQYYQLNDTHPLQRLPNAVRR